MLLRLSSRLRRQDGFSLIEVLIVLIMLAILAAIVLPALLGQSKKGDDASAKSDARAMASAVEHCSTDGNGYTECDEESELGISGLSWGDGPGQVQVIASAAREYTIRAVSRGERRFSWTKLEDGRVERNCEPMGEGGCSTDGDW